MFQRYSPMEPKTHPTGDSRIPETISLHAVRPRDGEADADHVDSTVTTPSSQASSPIRYQPLTFIRGAFDNAVGGVKNFVEYPFLDRKFEKQAHDTLSGLEPFFWVLRLLGLCPRVGLFDSDEPGETAKSWNKGLMVHVVIVGTFLWMGLIATFGFSILWPIAFCSGFQSMMFSNQSYCQTDIMSRFLTLKGMNALIQSSFLFIGSVNMVVSVTACVRIGPMVKLLRKYYAITPAAIAQSHRKTAIVHAGLTIISAAIIGIPFTFVYEDMLNEIKTEGSYEGYPFASIDTPLVKIENWIAYTKQNASDSKTQKFVLSSVKYVFRAENFFSFLSCFAVPFFFSLMCDVLGKEWKRFVAFLRHEKTRELLSPEVLRNVRHSHWMLCKLFGLVDECFSFMTLVIYIMFIIVNSSITFIVLKFGARASGQDRHAFYQAILMFVALQVIFFLVVRQAMRVYGITKNVVAEIRDWQPIMNGILDSEYLLLVNQVTTTDVSFTAWNCFRIEEAAYINALAIIFGYVLMMLQYQPPGH